LVITKGAFLRGFSKCSGLAPLKEGFVGGKNSQGAHRLSEYFSKSWGVIYE